MYAHVADKGVSKDAILVLKRAQAYSIAICFAATLAMLDSRIAACVASAAIDSDNDIKAPTSIDFKVLISKSMSVALVGRVYWQGGMSALHERRRVSTSALCCLYSCWGNAGKYAFLSMAI